MQIAVKLSGYLWRPLTSSEEDTAFVLQVRNSPHARAAFFTTVITREDHLRFLKSAEAHGDINWIIEKDEERVGTAGIYHLDHKNRRAEGGRIAVTVPEAHFLNSFVTCYVVFEVLKLNKLYGEALATNTVSNKSMERLGLVQEGVLREHVFVEGVARDVCVYGLLASEWKKLGQGLMARFGKPEVAQFSEDLWAGADT